jgi:hypothetical protein
MIKRILLFTLSLVTLLGCTRDDICEEGAATTPLLIITFNDVSNPTERKSVDNLSVETADLNSTEVIAAATTDSIAVPLRNSGLATQYRFNSGVGTSTPNTDVVSFNYTTEDIYVNRACAFKTIYHDLSVFVQNEGTANWIIQVEIETTDVIDETEAHITILH